MPKSFDHVISMGLNCEIAHHLRINHGFVESGLLTWSACPAESLESVLQNSGIINSKGLCPVPTFNMFVCHATQIYFHGRRQPNEVLNTNGEPDSRIIDNELRECASRIDHLRDKALKLAANEESKLYIVGLHPEYLRDAAKNLIELINTVHKSLTSMARNATLLVIGEDRQKNILKNCPERANLFIRFVSHFAPRSQATNTEVTATADYSKIFSEFVPTRLMIDNKTYKYDAIR